MEFDEQEFYELEKIFIKKLQNKHVKIEFLRKKIVNNNDNVKNIKELNTVVYNIPGSVKAK